jgi:hypothetical protein
MIAGGQGENTMKNFLAIYLADPASAQRAGWDKLDEATRQSRMQSGMKAWHGWMSTHKDAVVVSGGPLGKTKKASRSSVADIKNNMTGFVVVQAETHEAAAQMFKDHPHFTIFPGESVEIMECLPIPGE